MAIVSCSIEERASYADGRPFGAAGPYERLRLRLEHAVDPDHPRNRAVPALDRAPRAEDGAVRFTSDVVLLRPAAADRPAPTLVDVVNRGRATFPNHLLLDAADPTVVPAEPPPGDGWLLAEGWALAAVGWQHDLDHPRLVGCSPPPALDEGRPLAGTVTYRFQPPAPTRVVRLAMVRHAPHPADLGRADEAVLLEGEGPGARVVPRDEWAFAEERDGEVVPSAVHVRRAAGFTPGRQHQVTYPAVGGTVVGCGALALRDAAAGLGVGLPGGGPPARFVIGFGVSQSGRLLRQLLADGLVVAEDGRRAFDGLLVVIAGARRGEFTRPFATPGNLPVGAEGMDGPVTYQELLAPLRAAGDPTPRVVAVNTAAEYWRGDGALAHLDAHGRDLAPDPDVRLVAVAGAQHSPGVVPQAWVAPALGLTGRYGLGTIDHRPVTRAALAHLAGWVDGGAEPPPSTHPRAADGTAAPRAEVAAAFRRLGIDPPADPPTGPAAPVSAVDDDGNEVAGVRLPDVAAPLGVHAGWNLWPVEHGVGDGAVPLYGLTRWFPPEELARRWGDRAGYLARVDQEVARLVAEGWVRVEDADVLRASAGARWDDATSARAGAVPPPAGVAPPGAGAGPDGPP